jgi:hypothetical protein
LKWNQNPISAWETGVTVTIQRMDWFIAAIARSLGNRTDVNSDTDITAIPGLKAEKRIEK